MNEPAFCSEFQPAKALTCSQFLSFFSSILGRQTYQSPIICNTALIIWRNHEKPFCRQQTHADSQIQSIFVMRSCDEVHKTSGELFLRSPRTRKAHNRTFQPSAWRSVKQTVDAMSLPEAFRVADLLEVPTLFFAMDFSTKSQMLRLRHHPRSWLRLSLSQKPYTTLICTTTFGWGIGGATHASWSILAEALPACAVPPEVEAFFFSAFVHRRL